MKKFLQKLKAKPLYLVLIGLGILFLMLIVCILTAVLIYKTREDSKENENANNQNEKQEGTQEAEVTKNIGEVVNDNPNCSLPVIEYKKNAFSFGVPKGWIYDVNGGTVAISQDDTNTVSTYLYTAKLEEDITGKEFLERFAQIFEQTFADLGGTFSMADPETKDSISQASTSGNLGSDKIQGMMKAEVKEGFIILKSYWAPVSQYNEKLATFEEISNCFARTKIITDEILNAEDTGVLVNETASQFATYQGRYFKLSKPDNFTVTGETDSGIDLTRSDGNAGYSYAYATGVAGTYTPETWAKKALPEFAGISSLQLSKGRNITSPISGQTIQEFDFTGYLNGSISVKGKTTVGIYLTPYTGIGTRYSSAFWGIQIATPTAWNGASATLQEIQDSLVITDIGNTRKNTILPPNRPIESVSASKVTRSSSYSSSLEKSSGEKWDDAMRGYETVESPTTGDRYDVPQNSWSDYGPDGPGYYRQTPDNSLEKLNQTTL